MRSSIENLWWEAEDEESSSPISLPPYATYAATDYDPAKQLCCYIYAATDYDPTKQLCCCSYAAIAMLLQSVLT
eukprot:2631002-Rhodomonas_salina.1